MKNLIVLITIFGIQKNTRESVLSDIYLDDVSRSGGLYWTWTSDLYNVNVALSPTELIDQYLTSRLYNSSRWIPLIFVDLLIYARRCVVYVYLFCWYMLDIWKICCCLGYSVAEKGRRQNCLMVRCQSILVISLVEICLGLWPNEVTMLSVIMSKIV